MAFLYGIQSGLFIKIGVASSMAKRLRTMNLYNPHPCKVVVKRQLYGEAFTVERKLHQVLAPYAIGREWFAVDVALVRAALSLVVKQVRDDRIAWQIECTRRQAAKENKRAARGRDVESETSSGISEEVSNG